MSQATEFWGLLPGGALPDAAKGQVEQAIAEAAAGRAISLTGPGRPDQPATTGGIITGSEPVGTAYISTDGAGVGAWAWRKRPSGWEVTDGDTGWRDIRTLLSEGWELPTKAHQFAIRRTAPDRVELKGRIGSLTDERTILTTFPEGFLAAEYLPLAHGLRLGPGPVAAITLASNSSASELRIYPPTGPGDTLLFRGAFASTNLWPTTLPGSPA